MAAVKENVWIFGLSCVCTLHFSHSQQGLFITACVTNYTNINLQRQKKRRSHEPTSRKRRTNVRGQVVMFILFETSAGLTLRVTNQPYQLPSGFQPFFSTKGLQGCS